MITINISDCPHSGLQRKAEYIFLQHNVKSKDIVITVEVTYQSSDENILAKGIAPYQVNLTANNSTKVNPANGDFVDAEFEGSVGQYDLIIGAMQLGTNPFALIQAHMEKADTLNKYN